MIFDIQKKDRQSVIKIENELTIADVSSLKETIIKEIPSCDTMIIDLEHVDTIDIAGLQLLCSASRSFEKKKKSFYVETGKDRDSIKTFMIQAGYDESGGCHESSCKRCLWKGET